MFTEIKISEGLLMYKFNKLTYAICLSLFSYSTLVSYHANAQPTAHTTGIDENSALESNIEIIEVYAQKRAQNINDVAIAITSIDGENVDTYHLKDTTQLGALVPNLKITSNAGEGTPPAFNIRGVGMIDYNTSTISPIAVYSDGVVGGSANNLSVNLFDVDHVEVLRGPQGTLFGRNTTGGAILLMSNQPTQEFGGYINANVAQQNTTSIMGAVNVPISDSTAIRFALNHEDYQFSTQNLMAAQSDGGLEQTNLRLIIKTELEDFTLTTKLHHEDWDGTSKPIGSLGVLKTDGSGLCSPAQAGTKLCEDAFGSQNGGDDYWDVRADNGDRTHKTDSWGADFTLEWRLSDDMTLTSISGYKDLERYHGWDSDGPMNLIEGTMDTENSIFSQEVNLAIQNGDTYWMSGVFYVNEETDQNNDIDLFRDFRGVLPAGPAQFFYDNTLENRSLALYSQVDYPLTNNLMLTGGIRYTDETTDYQTIADLDIDGAYIPNLWNIVGKVEDDEYSGKLALTQKLDNFTSIYYSYARGYKSGGYNAGYSTSEEQALDSEYTPEKLNAYEIGSKLQFWQQQASLHVAAFYYDYESQQVFVNMTSGIAPYHVLKNAGDSTIYGLETEFVYTPTSNMQMNLNVGYLPKANMGSYQDGDIIVNDNRLPFSSKWNVSGYFLYEAVIMGGVLTSLLNFDYQSDFYFDQNENPYTEQTGFVIFNGNITFQANDNVAFSLWGKNLTNTEHSELRFDSIAALATVTELKAEGRQIGAGITYRF